MSFVPIDRVRPPAQAPSPPAPKGPGRLAPVPAMFGSSLIISEVSLLTGVPREWILCKRNFRKLVRIRQFIAWRCSVELKMSQSAIGKRLGQDHSTVFHSITDMDARLAELGSREAIEGWLRGQKLLAHQHEALMKGELTKGDGNG